MFNPGKDRRAGTLPSRATDYQRLNAPYVLKKQTHKRQKKKKRTKTTYSKVLSINKLTLPIVTRESTSARNGEKRSEHLRWRVNEVNALPLVV
jgi:hypothetical protein